jgi:hypothetical protein
MQYKLSQYDFVYKQYLDLGTELRAYANAGSTTEGKTLLQLFIGV